MRNRSAKAHSPGRRPNAVLSAFEEVDTLADAVHELYEAGFDRSETCLLLSEPTAAAVLGVVRGGGYAAGGPSGGAAPPLGPGGLGEVVLLEPDQAAPGQALAISRGTLWAELMANPKVTDKTTDMKTVLRRRMKGDNLAWTLERLSRGSMVLGIRPPTGLAYEQAMGVLAAMGASEIRALVQTQ